MEREVFAFGSVAPDTLAARRAAVTESRNAEQSGKKASDTSAEAPTPTSGHGTDKPEHRKGGVTLHPIPATGKSAVPAGGSAPRTDSPGHDGMASLPHTENAGNRPVSAADSLLFAANSPGMLHDSTFFAAETLRATPPSPFRDVTPGEIFGETSTLVPFNEPLRERTQPVTGDPFFQIFLLLLAALYARFVYQNLSDVRLLFARTSKDSVSAKQRLFDDQSNVGYSRFLNATWAVGLLFTGAAALKFGAEWLPAALPPGGALALSLALSLGCLLLALVQFGALSLAGALTLNQPFTGQLIHLRRAYFAVAFLALAPVCLLYILCDEGRGAGYLYVIASEAVVISLLFIKESLTLFISKKIPILHWFLYLCTVECLPLSFIALMAVRH